MLFHAMIKFCLDLLRSKFWLIGEWSNGENFGLIGIQLPEKYKENFGRFERRRFVRKLVEVILGSFKINGVILGNL